MNTMQRAQAYLLKADLNGRSWSEVQHAVLMAAQHAEMETQQILRWGEYLALESWATRNFTRMHG